MCMSDCMENGLSISVTIKYVNLLFRLIVYFLMVSVFGVTNSWTRRALSSDPAPHPRGQEYCLASAGFRAMANGVSAPMQDSKPTPLFAATRWSMVLAAGDREAPERDAALNALCTAYWYPLYAYIRSRGMAPEDAKDLTQDFIASLLRRGSLSNLSPERGRFRSYLLAALKKFLADEHSRAAAAKRGGGEVPISLDAMSPEARYALEPATTTGPDALFDRRWACALADQALERLRDEMRTEGNAGQFDALKPFLASDAAAGDYDALAGSLGISPNTLAQQVRRMRQRFRKLLLAEAAQTVATPGEAEAELRALFA